MKRIILLCFVVALLSGCTKGMIPQSTAERHLKEKTKELEIKYAIQIRDLKDEIIKLRIALRDKKYTKVAIIKEDRKDLIEAIKMDIDNLKDKMDEYK